MRTDLVSIVRVGRVIRLKLNSMEDVMQYTAENDAAALSLFVQWNSSIDSAECEIHRNGTTHSSAVDMLLASLRNNNEQEDSDKKDPAGNKPTTTTSG